jgi:hypothetical protein
VHILLPTDCVVSTYRFSVFNDISTRRCGDNLLAGNRRDWCSSSHDADFMLSSMDSLSPSDKVWIYKLLFKHISYFYVFFALYVNCCVL